jgi:hypothetical protein
MAAAVLPGGVIRETDDSAFGVDISRFAVIEALWQWQERTVATGEPILPDNGASIVEPHNMSCGISPIRKIAYADITRLPKHNR